MPRSYRDLLLYCDHDVHLGRGLSLYPYLNAAVATFALGPRVLGTDLKTRPVYRGNLLVAMATQPQRAGWSQFELLGTHYPAG